MSDDFEIGSGWLVEMRRAYKSRTVAYVRAEGLSSEITASVLAGMGRSFFRVEDEYGLFQRIESRDYLIEVADLAEFGEPERGDLIKDMLDGNVEVFEVMAPNGEDAWRFSDQFRKVYRIHTKHVGRDLSS